MKRLYNILILFALGITAFAAPPHPGIDWGFNAVDETTLSADAPVQAAAVSPVLRTPGKKNLAPKGLVILANFADIHFRPENTHAEMDSMMNGTNYNYYKSIGSARKYFCDQSFGQYNPVFDVVGPVLLPDSLKYYSKNISKNTDGKNADMVLKACSIASQIDGVNFADYDNDNDGKLDFVYVIHAGYGENDSYVDTFLWASSWNMPAAVRSGRTSLPTNASASQYTFQGKTIDAFAYSAELNYFNTIARPTPGYSDSLPLRSGIGVVCHEFGHVLGLPDYYDTRLSTNFNLCLTPGNWDVMDVGMYNSEGYIPPAYSPHERWWLGWGTPTLLNDTAEITLPANDSVAYYITKTGASALATTPDTIYYLANRQLTGWNQGLPGHGMLIWRVVYNSSSWSNNTPNNTANQPRYLHMAADTTYTYNSRTGLQGDSGDPFPGTENVHSFLPFPDKPITDINENDGVISFRFMWDDDTTQTALPQVTAAEPGIVEIFTLTGTKVGNSQDLLPAGIYIIRKDNVTQKIIVR